jgi:hypothetical protein
VSSDTNLTLNECLIAAEYFPQIWQVSSDTNLTLEENASLQFMTSPKNSADGHPDAHACRLKISLVRSHPKFSRLA